MPNRLILQSNTAYDSVYNESPNIELLYAQPYNIPEFLTLKLCNNNSSVYINSLFSVYAFAPFWTTPGFNSYVTITISFYRDEDRTNLAYTTTNHITGLKMNSITFSDVNTNVWWNIPISFEDTPLLKATDDTIYYYVTVIGTLNVVGPASFTLTSYCFNGTEY